MGTNEVDSISMKRFLALVGAVLLLLRPYCDAWAAPGYSHADIAFAAESSACDISHGANPNERAPCCASLDKDVIAKASAAGAVPAGSGSMALIPPAPAWIAARYGGAAPLASRKSSGLAPPVLSYYARSARILR
jgi:hypothetical protein